MEQVQYGITREHIPIRFVINVETPCTSNEEAVVVDWDVEEIKSLQDKQPEYKMIKSMIVSRHKVEEIERWLKENKLKARMPIVELGVEDGLLYRMRRNSYDEESKAVVLPPEYSL